MARTAAGWVRRSGLRSWALAAMTATECRPAAGAGRPKALRSAGRRWDALGHDGVQARDRMPHQLRLGLRAAHDLLELGQERLRGRLVTELQVDEDLVRLGDAAAHPIGLHALLGAEPLVPIEVHFPAAEVLDGVLDVDGGHVSSSDRWKTRLRRRHAPSYPKSGGFPPPYAEPMAASRELADRAAAVC